ncbi:MAG: CHAT domain-containing protein [Pseudonocardiaceae bacterium]
MRWCAGCSSSGFPSGLLQTGVAGVLASQWQVQDQAGYYLTLWFHDLWRAGQPPAVALANAQSWLRRATNSQLAATFGADYLPLFGYTAEELAAAAERPYSEPASWAAFSFTGA